MSEFVPDYLLESTIKCLEWPSVPIDQLSQPQPNEALVCLVTLTRNGHSTLSDSERLHAIEQLSDIQWDRFERRQGELKEAYLAGRYYLWQLLSRLTDTPIDDLSLGYNRLNKPYLEPNPMAIEFNVSDTRCQINNDLCMIGIYAFARETAVGIDLEATDRRSDAKAIANKRFSQNELDYVRSDHTDQRFLQIWTRKEAFGKAAGVGINFKMQSLDLLPTLSSTMSFSALDADWVLQQLLGPQQQIICLVHQGTKLKSLKNYWIETPF